MCSEYGETNESLLVGLASGLRSLLDQLINPGVKADLLRYLVVGGLNTILTFMIFVAGFYILHIHYLMALIAAFLASNVFTYVLSYVWMFCPETDFMFRGKFTKHSLPNVGTFSLNLLALYILVDCWSGDQFLCNRLSQRIA